VNLFIVTIIPDQTYVTVKERAAKLESGEWTVTPGSDGKKLTGPCPVNGQPCADVTGRRHSIVVEADDVEKALLPFHMTDTHVTRVEQVVR
jgi:hypothetical protein